MVTLTEIDNETSVVEPQRPLEDRKRGEAGRSGSSQRFGAP
jgi:hypothetical protein